MYKARIKESWEAKFQLKKKRLINTLKAFDGCKVRRRAPHLILAFVITVSLLQLKVLISFWRAFWGMVFLLPPNVIGKINLKDLLHPCGFSLFSRNLDLIDFSFFKWDLSFFFLLSVLLFWVATVVSHWGQLQALLLKTSHFHKNLATSHLETCTWVLLPF